MAAFKFLVLIFSIPTVLSAYSFQDSTRTLSLGSCNDTSPCNIENSICHKQTCVCCSGCIIDSSETKCLKVATQYGDLCQDNAHQCTEFLGEGAVCQDKKCACRWGHYLHGRCHWPNKIGDICSYDDECFDGSEYQATSCKNGICECSEGFYPRGRTMCRRKQKNIGDECLLDRDCDFAKGICELNKCRQKGYSMRAGRNETGERFLKKRFAPNRAGEIGSTCKNDNDCQSIENSICHVDGTCICKRAHFPSQDKTACVPEIGEKCDPSNVSSQVEHSVCRENMWTCPIDRVASKDNRECKKTIGTMGEHCEVEEECRLFGPRAECQSSECKCNSSSSYKESKHFCWDDRKDGSELGTYCKERLDCDAKYSHCESDKCTCDKNFFEEDGKCNAGLNAECQIDSDCKRKHSVCDKSRLTCKCESGLVGTPAPDDKCLPISKYNGTCQHDVQCSAALPNTFCKYVTDGQRCECLEKYYFMDGKCEPKKYVGDVCAKSEECFTQNTVCKDDHCACISTRIRDGDKCVLKIGGECKSDNECDMPNSNCQNNKCTCKNHYHDLDGLCAADNDNCKFEGMVCHQPSGHCQCQENYVKSSEVECLPKSQYNKACKHDVQCSSVLPHSICKEGLCQCDSHYPNYHDEQCNSSSTIISPLFSFIVFILLGLKAVF